ncbi:hypothetical protein PQO03_13195 [Lentisphaera profundi]|uniref:Uncharacterized protein n=1 Tax=Lentisphaera profundi TaxID=1658616 RepID=A0ABY7VXG2_9BACT|nr:hypothetical protein [Lentisphaera profundi]WDE98792.1 hypothetical protein PQO03_13195 [Lentisphaera profundi]
MTTIKVLLILGLGFFFTSCESHDWDKDDALQEMVQLFAILPDNAPDSQLTRTVPGANGRPIKVNRIPMLTNLELAHAETRYHDNNDDMMVIKVNLSGMGENKWRIASANYAGYRAVMMVGDEFKCFMKFDPYFQKGPVRFYCYLTSAEADEVCSLIKKNYKALVRK